MVFTPPIGGFRSGLLKEPQSQPVRFGIDKKNYSFATQTDVISVKQPAMRKFFHKLISMTPLLNIISGVSLITSSFLSAKVDPPQPEAAIHAPATPGSQPTTYWDDLQQHLPEVKNSLRQLGWSLISVSLLLGNVNCLAMASAYKQPSMMLSCLASLGLAPVLVIDPSIPVRAALGLTTALWFAGYSTHLKNKYGLKPGDKPREFDFTPLFQKSALKAQVEASGEDASKGKLLKAWFKQFGAMTKFVATDMGIVVTDNAKRVQKLVTRPGEVASEARRTFRDIVAFMKNPGQTQPGFMKPNPAHNQVGAMIMFLGNTPMLFLGGPIPEVADVCMKISAMGELSGNISLAVMGVHEKEKSLIVGIPLLTVGNAWGQTDGGVGVARLGLAGVYDYFNKQAAAKETKPTPAGNSPPAQDNKPEEKPPK